MQRIPRSEDEYRHGAGQLAAQAARELQAVHPGQADVHDGQIKTLLAQHLHCTLGAGHPIDRVARVRQAQLDTAGHHDIVFHQEQSHGLWPYQR